ncbi:MAG: CBS domain-containing protein [Gemmataceae bacterium]|nr:CBS domain-containing protein [Gemmataceae bacterium]
MICPHCDYDNLAGADFCKNCWLDLAWFDVPSPQDRVEKSLMEDLVGVLRPSAPVTLQAKATVAEAIQEMMEKNVGAILAVDAEQNLVGIFSERDLLNLVAQEGEGFLSLPISHFMTRNPNTVRGSDRLGYVLHKMDGGSYRHVPVVKDGKPLGMISVRDMLSHILAICKDR